MMEGEAAEKKAVIFACLKILFENLVKEEDIRQLANVLKKNDVISKGQEKTVSIACKNRKFYTGLEKLINSTEKGNLSNLKKALQEEGFPADQDAKILISHVIEAHDKNLIFIIKNWENLFQCEAELKHLVSGDEVGDKDWVKALVFAAFDEILPQKEEKPIFEFIWKAISNLESSKEQSAESFPDRPGRSMPVKLEWTEPPGSSYHLSEKEESAVSDVTESIIFSDVNTSPPPTKKSKIFRQEKSGLKRRQDDGGLESGSKKHKSGGIDQTVPFSGDEIQAEDVTSIEGAGDDTKRTSQTEEGQDRSGIDGDQASKSQGWTKLSSRRPTTRSVTAVKRNQEERKYDSSQPYITLLHPEALITNTDQDERVLEIRAIVSQSPPLPSYATLRMACPESGWKPAEMGYNVRKGYFFLRVLHNSAGSFKFKFCYVNQHTKEIEWENLPGSSHRFINRVLYLDKDCCKDMGRFLPDFKADITSGAETHISPAVELFSWVNCVTTGWRTDASTYGRLRLRQYDLEEILLKWLGNWNHSQSDDVGRKFLKIHIALVLAVAFTSEKHCIIQTKLAVTLFQMLSLRKLDRENCQKVYVAVKKEFEAAAELGIELPSYREAMEWLYRHIPDKPNLDWLFSLPLYWLLVHGEVKDEVLIPNPKRRFFYSRSSLPSIAGFDWPAVSRRLYSINERISKGLIASVLEAAELHPWIITTFQFLLTYGEAGKLILSREESKIAKRFSIDTIFAQYIWGYVYGNYFDFKSEDHQSCDDYFFDRLSDAIAHAAEPEITRPERIQQLAMCTNIVDFVNQFLKLKLHALENIDMVWCVENITQKTAYWASILDLEEEELKKFYYQLSKLLELVQKRIHIQSTITVAEVELWNRLIKIEWNFDRFARKWTEQIICEIKCAIMNSWLNTRTREMDGERYLSFYVDQLSNVDLLPEIEKCFNEIACTCMDRILKTTEGGLGLFGKLTNWVRTTWGGGSSSSKSRFIFIFEKLFKKSYRKACASGGSEMTIALNFLCKWSFAAHFYELFGQELPESFSNDTKSTVKKIAHNFTKVVKSLDGAKTTVENLEIILANMERFLLVSAVLLLDKKEGASTSAKDAIDLCEEYLRAFKRTKQAVEDFIHICFFKDYSDGELLPHEELMSKVKQNVQKTRLCDLVVIADDGQTSSNEFFGITDDQLAEFQQISFIKDSKKIFTEMFTIAVNGIEINDGIDKPWTELLRVFIDVKQQIFNLVYEIDSGTTTMDSVIHRFKILDGKKKEINCELELFYDFYSKFYQPDAENANLDIRILENREIRKVQIFNIFQLQSADNAVDTLLDLRDLLVLGGDFSALTDRKEMIEKRDSIQLFAVPEALTIPEICLVDTQKLTILKKFMDAKQVIKWLRLKMKGMNEVKVMCDLALISAGENAIEVDRVSNLLSAVMAFAPLIFWANNEREKSGSEQLLKICANIWKNAKATKDLILKWEETSRQLKWFQEVEEFYGSVEKSSLTRAQEINERGVYRISRQQANENLTVENCVRLVIPGKTCSDSALQLNLDELRELQSKLMLIPGEAEKGQQDVNVFVHVLTSVQKLAEVYVQLITSGCMLFTGWETGIICHGGGTLSIRISFIDDAPPIIGNGTHSELDKLTEILKKSLVTWDEHISSKRMEYYHLNEYNIQQIMYLCRELANLEDLEQIPEQVRALLTFVRKDFSIEDLRAYLQETRRNMKQSHHDVEIDNKGCEVARTNRGSIDGDGMEVEFQEDYTGSETQDDMTKKRQFVRNLTSQENVTEDEAKAAVQATGTDVLSSCIEWILLNGLDEGLVAKYSREFDDDMDFVKQDQEMEVVHSVFDPNSENTLKEVIGRLQEEIQTVNIEDFLNCVNTVCAGYLDETIAMNLQDHLSIGLLGTFLDNLSKEGQIHRDLRPGLRHGRPNLLICGEEEVLPTVISLYMHNMNQPLPSRSEVLVCGAETLGEEVERFLHRAMSESGNGDRLLYTLAFADKLNYSTSSKVEDIFNKLSKSGKVNEKYQLVILLSKQQHYLTTCFDNYVVDGKWSQATDMIQAYLKKHLEVAETETSATSVTKGNYMVKVVTSTRSGVGKSLYVQRLNEELRRRTDIDSRNVTIRLLENKLDLDHVMEKLNQNVNRIHPDKAILVHVDLTPAVQHGIELFAFNLFMLGSIQGSDGKVWKTHQNHLYVVEMTDFGTTGEKRFSSRHILNLLPCVKCYAPREVLNATLTTSGELLGMDEAEFRSETFQRPFQYLRRYQNNEDLDEFTYLEAQGNVRECIEILLRHCCIRNPSWAQLRHFCSFLNVQLKNCEKSLFCTHPVIKPHLAGLKVFAVKFMIKMAQDFATPSLEISDRSVKDSSVQRGNNQRGFEEHQIRRKWEETSHPYVFFNEDGQTMTFINVKINKDGFLVAQNGTVGTERIATPQLVAALQRQGFNFAKNFDDYSRVEKLRFLCQVLGKMEVFDPDPTYELTTDNVLKILAIYMRFRCQIPVIIMGETGCGKTRLVEFMSKLKSRKTAAAEGDLPRTGQNIVGMQKVVKNMITLKIHGGISVKNIHKSVEEAKLTEMQNLASGDHFTVLFYDEANTTEAIYAIKEVMCDKSIDGRFFGDSKLQIVAACNPYKKLSKAAIKKLEDSGLGYRIRTSETAHLFGNVPVRSLVYRVVALPPSMQPFVWDFGQLSDNVETSYIEQMARKLAEKLALTKQAPKLITNVLSSCQQYMRTRTDECRYVSLRDVERCMITYEWFFTRREVIYPAVEKEIKKRCEMAHTQPPAIDIEVRTIIQTIGVCYHASLDKREEFRTQLPGFLNVTGIDEIYIETELAACQDAFLRNVRIGENIACNEALRENVFMMAVCADMRIPLFLIGKPGSSKSLAKTIVTNNMQGQASHAPLYRSLKQIHVLSYQCSALTDAEGIERIFTQCSHLQKRQNPDAYTAVVVLDEIGLAEDSPNMPLKVLHPLLERRSTDLSTVAHPDTERVGFVGISNWALDPAKMNRGIFLTRTKPSSDDLKKTGKEIFQGKRSLWRSNQDLFEMLTTTYLAMYKEQEVEYFGLRDYYSLMKMICSRCGKSDTEVKFTEVVYAILRNFSGGGYQVTEGFLENTKKVLQIEEPIPTIPIQKMIMHNLTETDSRFLLLLANQFSVVSLLESCVEISSQGAQVVFGSSFPGDHSYTEICRNINRIKVCMETGRSVILLNMAKIHESLYDALNQHYVTFGGQNYVDLGLGGHRVKCRIANEFRLIVIEEKDTVYQQYPIPLINRLEKHHFNSDSLLDAEQSNQSKKLKDWASDFVSNTFSFTSGHAFVGFHDDTISSVVLTTEGHFDDYKSVLLQSCSMDAILRLPDSNLRDREVGNLQQLYFEKQLHDGLADVLEKEIKAEDPFSVLEITSFSGVLSKKDVERLHSDLDLQKGTIILLSLEQFHTRQEYSDRLDKFFGRCSRQDFVSAPMVLLVQCAKAQSQASLIACARHCLMNKIREVKHRISETGVRTNMTVALLLSTEREGISRSKMDALALQPTPETQIIHVDEMRPTDDHIAPASNFFGKTLREVFEAGKEELDAGRRLESLVNIQSLLVDCVCESVAKVNGQMKENERYLKRVEILMNLCSSNDIAGDNFRKILLKKVVEIVSEMENEDQGVINWITEKANDRESLQEGGTFRKTLWLCLKGHMSRFIAYIISIIDRRGNMDLIAKIPAVPWELNLWLDMFDQLETSWQNVKSGAKFKIHDSRRQRSCKLPFSFLIIDYLQIQWNALELQPSENFEESFFRLFHDFGMKKIITDALDFAKIDVMQNFISDVVGSLYRTGTEDKAEIEIVEKVIFDIAMKDLEAARDENYFSKGDEITVIFLTFKDLSDQLEKFSGILQSCPQVLRNSTKWNEKLKNSKEFTLHILAYKDVLNLLKNMAERIQDIKPCLDWIDLARTAKKIFDSISGVQNDAAILETLKKDWVPFFLLDLLLLQLLPPAHSDNAKFRNFVKVIAPHAKLFWRGSVSTDVRSYNLLRIVLNILKRCYADIHLHLLVNWRDMNCRICQKKVQNPTFLPCGHFGCEKCILQHVRTSKRCMTCAAHIPEDGIPHPVEIDEKQTRILENLKSNCTSFFLEYLQQFCFKNTTGTSGHMEQHVQQILKELIIQSDNEDDRKELDSTALDLNVNTKSCMLQILLQHNRSLVVERLNQALKETEGNARNLLITVILKNLEQKILAKSSKFVENEKRLTKFWHDKLGSSWHGLRSKEETKAFEFQDLQRIVELRCALMRFTSIVEEKGSGAKRFGDENIQIERFFDYFLDLLKSDNMPQAVRDFVIKAGCRKFGTQWFYQMAEHKDLRALIPPSLRQAAEGCIIDHWALLGREYIDTKTNLYQTTEDNQQRKVAAIFEQQVTIRLPYLLAVSSWCDNEDEAVKQAVADILKQKYGGSNFLVEFLQKGKDDLVSILENNVATTQEINILYQLIIMVVAAITSQNNIMGGFYDITNNPQSAKGLFLPAMPEDVFFATPADYRAENEENASMYSCPKGHLYSIGNCTQAVMETKCPTCNSTIGGRGYKLAAGNKKVIKTTQSQAGYKKVTAGETVSTGADRMSPQGAAVVHFILHSGFLAVFVNKQGAVSRAQQHPENWATLDARKTWEQTFRREYLLPIFQNLETEIENAQAMMREAEEAGSAPLNRLIHEVPDADADVETVYSWKEGSLWNIIEHPNSAHLIQVLGDKMEESGGEVLQIILHTPDLSFIRFLENVLQLQQKLTERYQYKVDMKDADQMTFRNHIIEDGRHSDEKAIMEYISAWNEVYKSLQNVMPDYLSECLKPISLDSPLSMVLPSIRGRGQCAKILAEYLIEIQNQFLTKCVKVIKPAQKLKEVEVHHLVSTDFVCINKLKDLLNLINMHTSYTITSDDHGRHHVISYNVEALEKQVREKFVMCKKSIKKNTIPCMKYPQDIGIGADWQKVVSSIPQDSLTAKFSQDIDRIVEKSHSSEVCEGVRTLTNAISFLAIVKVDPAKTLCEFLEKDLKLPSSRTSIIPRSAQISHVLSLYQRLTWHKSIIFVQQRLDPYKEALSGIVQELISEEVSVATLEAFEHIDVIMLQQRINEMLITGTPIDNPHWSLIEEVFPYIRVLEGNDCDDSWYSRLPGKLCYKHLGDLFRLTVECKANTRDMADQRLGATGVSALRMAKTAAGTTVTRLSSSKTMMFQLSEELDRRIRTKSTECKIIGPEGGFVENFGCKITFRKGTFKKDTKVKTSVITDFTACHEDRMPVAPTIECFPAGVLNPPALLEVEHWASPVKGDKTQYAEVFRKGGDEANSEFVAKLLIEENRPLSLNIDHFTLFDFVIWMVAGQATLQNRVYISNADQNIACVCCLRDEKIMTNVQQSMRESNYVPLLPLPETVHVKSGNNVTITITCLQPQGLQMSDQENGIDGVEVATVFSVNTIVRNSKEIRYLPISLENGDLANFKGLLRFRYAHDAVEGQNVRHPMQTRWPFRDAAPTHVANVRNVLNTYAPIRTNAIVGPDGRGQEN